MIAQQDCLSIEGRPPATSFLLLWTLTLTR